MGGIKTYSQKIPSTFVLPKVRSLTRMIAESATD